MAEEEVVQDTLVRHQEVPVVAEMDKQILVNLHLQQLLRKALVVAAVDLETMAHLKQQELEDQVLLS